MIKSTQMHETTLIYNQNLVQQGVRSYWMRSLGGGYWIALAVVVVSLVSLGSSDVAPWILVTFSVTVVVGLIFPVLLYVVHYRSSMGRFRRMGESEAKFIAAEDTFTFLSSIGTSELRWGVITRLWKFNGLWIFVYEHNGFSVLPIEHMSQTMRDFVEEKVRLSGGQVR